MKSPVFAQAALVLVPCMTVAALAVGIQNFHIRGESYIEEVTGDDFIEISIPELESEPKPVAHVELPEEVRGIYWTAVTAGTRGREHLLAFLEEAGLNALVIDIKMDNGELAFDVQAEKYQEFAQDNPYIDDLDELLERLGEMGIYRIARIAVMRDGAYATLRPEVALHYPGGSLWRDSIGSLWVDPAAEDVWDYNLDLARGVYARGFDEVQFDYVRFASDGSISSIVYPVYDAATESKAEVMQRFFAHVGGSLQEEGVPVSFDVFGMTMHSTSDYNIGQRLIDIYPYADFISPMVYPSHYQWNFRGLGNPALHPYEIVSMALDEGAAQVETELGVPADEARIKFRPWLQDFDIGAVYTAARIRAQIEATRDQGASGWLMWNARNVYEEAAYYGLGE